jgi:hypothetical protein
MYLQSACRRRIRLRKLLTRLDGGGHRPSSGSGYQPNSRTATNNVVGCMLFSVRRARAHNEAIKQSTAFHCRAERQVAGGSY